MTPRQLWKRLRRLLLLLLSTGALGATLYVFLVEAPYSPSGFMTPNEIYDLPRLVAHKAAGGGVPGNTLEAVQRLLETDVAAFEIDVRLSKDRVPVVLHEERLDGFTGFDTGRRRDQPTQESLRCSSPDRVASVGAICLRCADEALPSRSVDCVGTR